jgi:hypothetical protein
MRVKFSAIKSWWDYKESDAGKYKKHIGILFVCTLFSLFSFVYLLNYWSGQGSRMAITQEEVAKEMEYIRQYKANVNDFTQQNAGAALPVSRGEVETVQNNLLQKAKSYQLNVTLINTLQNQAATVKETKPSPAAADQKPAENIPDGIEYELGFTGNWEGTVKYLREMVLNPGLISIRSVAMKPNQSNSQMLETNIKYKVYFQ